MFHCTLHTPHLLSLTAVLFFASCRSHPAYISRSSSSSTDGSELIVVEEVLRCTPEWCRNATAGTQDNADNESVMDVMDDLIFLAKKPKQKHRPQLAHTSSSNEQQDGGQKQKQPNTATTFQQIDFLEGQQQQDALDSRAASSKALEHDVDDDFDDSSGNGGGDVVDIVDDEIELHGNDNDNDRSDGDGGAITPIDMSDFVTLIPAEEVKSIVANYYQHDAEVQRAYAYLRSADFAALKRHIIQVPEMEAFLRYLNNSGLDVMGFLNAVTTFTTARLPTIGKGDVESSENAVAAKNEIFNSNTPGAITLDPAAFEVTTTRQQLNGLHGLVDSVLSALPQDQILATFFDKLESNEQFSKLVGNIGSPAFAKILTDMERSIMLRNLIYSLHNNGIYVTRILDSLKAYFLLGGF